MRKFFTVKPSPPLFSMVKSMVDKTISFLNKKKLSANDGPWMKKVKEIAKSIGIDDTIDDNMEVFNTTVMEPFLTELVDNITIRFADTDIMDNLAILDTSTLEQVPDTYAMMEIGELATHFNIEDDILLNEWTSFCSLIGERDCQDRTLLKCLSFVLNPNFGLTSLFPNIISIFCTAAVLPLSTAEVERVFSQVKLVKSDHRNRMKQETLQNILHVKLNCNKECFENVCDRVVEKFFSVKNRRINQYMS